jgi:hypothetical protein
VTARERRVRQLELRAAAAEAHARELRAKADQLDAQAQQAAAANDPGRSFALTIAAYRLRRDAEGTPERPGSPVTTTTMEEDVATIVEILHFTLEDARRFAAGIAGETRQLEDEGLL